MITGKRSEILQFYKEFKQAIIAYQNSDKTLEDQKHYFSWCHECAVLLAEYNFITGQRFEPVLCPDCHFLTASVDHVLNCY